jgi:hypothetical protein
MSNPIRVLYPSLLGLAAAFATLAIPPSAFAISFTPIQPATCGSSSPWTLLNYQYRVGGGTGVWEVPNDWNDGSVYQDHQAGSRMIKGNTFISQMDFRTASFNIESGYDFLRIFGQTSIYAPYPASASFTGTLAANSWIGLGASILEGSAFTTNFTSDFSVGASGFALDRIRVCYDGSFTGFGGGTQVRTGSRSEGVLLGTNDAVTFSELIGSEKNAASCPDGDTHTTIAVWSEEQNTDFDVFVRCGALPTPTNFTASAESTDSQEFIHLDESQCPCGSYLYITVASFNGAGVFNLVTQKHMSSHHRGNLQAEVQGSQSLALRNTYGAAIAEGVRRWVGASEGSDFWTGVDVWNNGNSNVDLIVWDASGRPNSTVCTGKINMYRDWFDGPTIMHEMGHRFGCYSDEYVQPPPGQPYPLTCGHSVMASQFGTQTNVCSCYDWSFYAYTYDSWPSGGGARCHDGYGGHNHDPRPDTAPLSGQRPWFTERFLETPYNNIGYPDTYTFADFDFNGQLPIVVH